MVNRRGRLPVNLGRTKEELLEVRIDSSEKEALRSAAVLAGVTLSVWVRKRLREVARRELEENGQEVVKVKEELAKKTGIIVPLQSFAPEPYLLRETLYVLVQPVEESFVATFVDANINASGETLPDAIGNLKDLIIALYERLSTEKKSKLGKGPTRQLAVLQSILRRKRRNGIDYEGTREKAGT
jgi:uncharacterized protein (DUF1778 family)